ncbi:MAG TPA: 3-dehydroquinate synthase [Acidobacteriaceae bacterium]
MRTIAIQTASARYRAHIGSGLLPTLASRIARLGSAHTERRLFVITSPEIWDHWANAFLASFEPSRQPAVLFLPAGEQHKRLAQVERLAGELARLGADRSSLLLAFGGGIVGDLTGFLAAIYMRGIDYVQVPSTLLAQVDSSIGAKTGVNLAAGKNLAGSFHAPLAVLSDTTLLSTLPERELRAGLFESLKIATIRDRGLFRSMEQQAPQLLARDPEALAAVIARSVALKAEIVQLDERESGLRMVLNFGHTIGHALESVTRYRSLLHGEAVAWGMLAALRIARERATVTDSEAARIERAIHLYGPLPAFRATAASLLAATGSDKKNHSGRRRFILPRGIGDATILEDVTDAELQAGIATILRAGKAVETSAPRPADDRVAGRIVKAPSA